MKRNVFYSVNYFTQTHKCFRKLNNHTQVRGPIKKTFDEKRALMLSEILNNETFFTEKKNHPPGTSVIYTINML